MSLVEFLLDTRTPLELAKELAAMAKRNAALEDEVGQLKTELFWTNAHFQKPIQRAQTVVSSNCDPHLSLVSVERAIQEVQKFLKKKHE